jgi:hypothetical protein
MGSAGIAAWIAKIAFLALLVWGATAGELRPKAITVFLLLGIGAWIGLPYLPGGSDFVTSALALIEIALVFAVFKGDIRLT